MYEARTACVLLGTRSSRSDSYQCTALGAKIERIGTSAPVSSPRAPGKILAACEAAKNRSIADLMLRTQRLLAILVALYFADLVPAHVGYSQGHASPG